MGRQGDEAMDIKQYKKDFSYSYTLGAFPTFELIDSRPHDVLEVFCSSSFTEMEKLGQKCTENGIGLTVNDKVINKLSDKGNVYVVGLFRKYEQDIDNDKPHLVLVNPSDMGNLGTIIRTAVGFGIMDLAIIEPAADVFNPKTVRASMGSVFRLRHKRFSSFEEYMKYAGLRYSDTHVAETGNFSKQAIISVNSDPAKKDLAKREIFTFMLNGENQLTVADCPKPELYSLVFGNEAAGLPDEFLAYGTSILIPQTEYVDSLNLTIAAGIGMYMFTCRT